MEIEKKFLVRKCPDDLECYPSSEIEQGYLSGEPVIRIRRMDAEYILTYKSKNGIEHFDNICVNQEVELPLTKEAYEHLKEKVDGAIIQKTRYRIAYDGHMIELDVFHGKYEGMIIAEVEFANMEEAEKFVKPDWFGENVSGDFHYANAYLALGR